MLQNRPHHTCPKPYRLLLAGVILFALGCGQTGPLKLPEDDKTEEAAK